MISTSMQIVSAAALCLAVGQMALVASASQEGQPSAGQGAGVSGAVPATSAPTQPTTASRPAMVRIVLVGDSTVTDKAGWGGKLPEFFVDGVEIINTASGGKSTKSFRDRGLWAKALELKGDYIFIQFGHNDCPGKGPERETDPNTTYRQNLERYIDEARQAGAKPILVTPMTRRRFEQDGKIRPTLKPYAQAMRAVAAKKHVPLIELYDRSIALFEKVGEKVTDEIGSKGGTDHTHFNDKGNRLWCSMIVEQIPSAVPSLAKYVKPANQWPKVTLGQANE